MAPDKALVSIIVPCYNHGQYLEESVVSVLRQTYSSWECIIVDDGSTDNTAEVATALVAADSRIRFAQKNNGGLSSARNHGISLATGSFILPLDADDRISANYIEAALVAFEDENTKVVYCQAEFFGAKSGAWVLPEYTPYRLARQNMIFCSAVFRKTEWSRTGGYDESLKLGSEDWEFWINVLKHGGNVVRLPFVGFFYRIRNDSMLNTMQEKSKFEIAGYISRKHCEFVQSQLGNPIYMSYEIEFLRTVQLDMQEFEQKLNRSIVYRALRKFKIV